jgi:hypothetical protein
MQPAFETFEQFWPYYVARHARPATRWLHLGGFAAGLVVAGLSLRRRKSPASVAVLPAIRYSAAIAAHRFVERNEVFAPALSLDQKLWYVRADARMWTMMLTGRDAELQLLADRWLAAS